MKISSRFLIWLGLACLLTPLAAPAQLVQKTIGYEGGTRVWYEHVPASYDGTKAVPLVISLHGILTTGELFAPESEWVPVSDANGFIVIFPNGDGNGTGLSWHDWVFDGSKPDDIGFLVKVINKLEATYKIDATRIYMTGFSDGGDMTSFFASARGDLLAGIAPWAGDWSTGDNQPASQLKPVAPVPEWLWRGTADNSDPGPPTLATQDQEQTNFWIKLANDNPTPQVTTLGDLTTSIYTGGAAEVRYTTIYNFGHGVQTGTAAHTWNEFFSRFSRVNGVIKSNGPPAVKVRASVPKTHASTQANAVFLLSLDGTTADDLTVNYQLGGTGLNGVDYRLLPGSVTMPAGTSSKKVRVHPLIPTAETGNRTVLLTVVPDAAYTLDGTGTAKVKIIED